MTTREKGTMRGKVTDMLVSGMGAALLTGATAWMVFGGDKVSRQEMVAFLDTSGSWNREKGAFELEIKTNKETLARLEGIIEKLAATEQQLVTEQRVLVEQVNRLISGK
jgi:hypothetical protein